MNIKMIVTDLDRTLLRTDKTISEYTMSVFKRCSEKGIKVVFATARPIRTVKSMNIGIENDAAIYHNGAVVVINDVIIQRFGIENNTAKKLLLQTAEKFEDLKISVEIDDVFYANFDVSDIWNNTTAIMTDFTDLPEKTADKIIFGTADGSIISEIETLLTDELYMEIADNQLLMIMNKNARKINAVKSIAENFGIDLCYIAAFGDDFNDVGMLKECGIGIAVENAINSAKNAADFVCESNDNDGAAKWIDKNILCCRK